MQNFGRGMWRRVGDYERVQKPILLQQARIEQLQKMIEYQAILKRQKDIKEYREKMLNQTNSKTPNLEETVLDSNNTLELESEIESDIKQVEILQEQVQHISIDDINTNDNTNNIQNEINIQNEPPSIVPKKTKKKNKNK